MAYDYQDQKFIDWIEVHLPAKDKDSLILSLYRSKDGRWKRRYNWGTNNLLEFHYFYVDVDLPLRKLFWKKIRNNEWDADDLMENIRVRSRGVV